MVQTHAYDDMMIFCVLVLENDSEHNLQYLQVDDLAIIAVSEPFQECMASNSNGGIKCLS